MRFFTVTLDENWFIIYRDFDFHKWSKKTDYPVDRSITRSLKKWKIPAIACLLSMGMIAHLEPGYDFNSLPAGTWMDRITK
jgi:hypothetical protein